MSADGGKLFSVYPIFREKAILPMRRKIPAAFLLGNAAGIKTSGNAYFSCPGTDGREAKPRSKSASVGM